MKQHDLTPLTPNQLRWRCSAQEIQAARELTPTSERSELPPLYFTQGRALESIRLGMKIDAPGYHLFIAGPPGTGKSSTIKALVRSLSRPPRERFDYVYVNNFDDGDRPELLTMKRGEGRALKRQVSRFVERLPEVIHSALSSERVERKRRELNDGLLALREEALEALQERCEREGFALIRTGEDLSTLEVAPLGKRKKPMHLEEWVQEVLAGKIKGVDPEVVLNKHAALELELTQIWERASLAEWEARRALGEVELQEVKAALRHASCILSPFYQDVSAQAGAEAEAEVEAEAEAEAEVEAQQAVSSLLSRWVKGLIGWVEEHIEELKEYKSAKEEPMDLRDVRVLQVNLIHEAEEEAPLVFEQSPTLINLLGTIDRSGEDTHPHLDFGDIRGGSLLKANGGVLVINANDMSNEVSVWRAVLRTLRSRSLEIQSPDQLFLLWWRPPKPTPIPLDVKIIALGDDELYRVLFATNEDFGRVFKVKVEFDDTLPNSLSSLALDVAHADRVVSEERLPKVSDEALALWAEFGTRLSGHQGRLSTHLGALTDLLREAAFYAQDEPNEGGEPAQVGLEHMRRALKQRFERHQLIEDHLFKMFEDEALELEPSGEAVGSAVGLTVLDFGDHACGQPCKVSASVSPGDVGVVSIEREVELSGRLHDKGALTIGAYLRAHYLPDQICALNATLCFDQLHDEIEGDSASLAEMVALLSALSGLPVAQNIAMTGALDLRGRVQAIGGVNEKIEGFFRLCKLKGLTGEQGVLIPRANIKDLSLRQEVLNAVEAGQFTLWSAAHLDEALSLVMGKVAGARELSAEGEARFPAESVNAAVRARLLSLSETASRFYAGRRSQS